LLYQALYWRRYSTAGVERAEATGATVKDGG